MWPFNRNSAGAVRSSEAYWLLRNGIGDANAALDESIDCDIAIIGAGITAALVADALIATGKRIVVLDSRDIAQGSTAASTALLQYEIDTHLVELTRTAGRGCRDARLSRLRGELLTARATIPRAVAARGLRASPEPVPGFGREGGSGVARGTGGAPRTSGSRASG